MFRLMTFASIAAVAMPLSYAHAQDLKINEVTTLVGLSASQIKPNAIAFSDQRKNDMVDPSSGLIKFEDWARKNPIQRELLSLYPSYVEPTVTVAVDGTSKPITQKLSMYVVEARFTLPKPTEAVDLKSYATIPFLTKIDAAIKHREITKADVIPASNPDHASNMRPGRAWCEDPEVKCIQSKYQLEGKLPTGIYLVNQLTEGKKHADYLEFQSELRVVPQAEMDQGKLKKITGIDTPVVGVLEQNIFYVNQVMEFGKFIAVLQQHPTDKSQTIATAYMALAIKTKVLDRKKEFERVPVLRNLLPGQLLMGNSTFNTGSSLSAGLPSYTRNQIQAIANILVRG